jgi:hypothetical protein
MNDELDPKLLSLFADSHQPLDDAGFSLKTLAAVEYQLRLHTRHRIAAIAAAIAVAIAATPWLVDFSVVLFGGFAASPWAWLAPMPIGLLLAYRSNGLRWPR